MSNSQVFGSPMNLTGRKPVSPFGAAIPVHSGKPAEAPVGHSQSGHRLLCSLRGFLAPSARERRIRTTVTELSRLDDRMLRDIGLDRSAIISAAHEAQGRKGRRFDG